MLQLGDIHRVFPGGTVVVDCVNPVVEAQLVAVIGRVAHQPLWDTLLVDAGFDLDSIVDMDGWEDRVVGSETTHVLWVTDDVISRLEYGRLQVHASRWFTMKVPTVDVVRAERLRGEVKNWLSVWFGLTTNSNGMWKLGMSCVQCDGSFHNYDQRGLAWCRQHTS